MAVPPGVVTEISPLEPPSTTAVILVVVLTVKLVTAVPPILTPVTP
jgi:hypothetical protein